MENMRWIVDMSHCLRGKGAKGIIFTYDTSGGPAGLLFSIRLELPELELSRRFRLDRIAEAFAARYLEKCATGARAGTGAGAVFLDSKARLRYRSSIVRSVHEMKTQKEEAQRECYRSRIVLRFRGFLVAIYTSTPSDESSLHPGGNKEKEPDPGVLEKSCSVMRR